MPPEHKANCNIKSPFVWKFASLEWLSAFR